MLLTIVTVAATLGLALAGLVVAVLLGMRRKSRWATGPIVWFCRAWMNPRQMRDAGQPGAYAGIIRHTGRTSGRTYETPVGIVEDGDGFLVALVYGPRTSWLRNVLAAGEATIVHEGHTQAVTRPEVIPMDTVVERFAPSDRRSFRLLSITDCLRLQRAAAAP
jgi:deazaflavin-dependent oxidoreductase (nitroreductase family)